MIGGGGEVPFPSLISKVSTAQQNLNAGSSRSRDRPDGSWTFATRWLYVTLNAFGRWIYRDGTRLSRLLLHDGDSKALTLYLVFVVLLVVLEFLGSLIAVNPRLFSESIASAINAVILVVALVAMAMSKKTPDSAFTFGYGRIEILSAFCISCSLLFNGVFLIIDSIHIVIQAEVPQEHSERTLFFVVLRLCLDVFGLFLLKSSSKIPDPSVGGGGRPLHLHAIFLYVGIDAITLASVIIIRCSSNSPVIVAVTTFSICMVVAFLAWPLFIMAGSVLLQTRPPFLDSHLRKCINDISSCDGVLECRALRVWTFVPGQTVANLNIRIRSNADDQAILIFAHKSLSKFIDHSTVQIETDSDIAPLHDN